MPDVMEVYEMVTKQKPSDTGALERQRTRQIRTMRNRKVGRSQWWRRSASQRSHLYSGHAENRTRQRSATNLR